MRDFLSARWRGIHFTIALVLIPFLAYLGSDLYNNAWLRNLSITNSFFGLVFAIAFGYFMQRRLTFYPGVTVASYIVLSHSLAFAVLIAVYFGLRLEYSRSMLLLGYFMSLLWFLGWDFVMRRSVTTRMAIIKGGNYKDVQNNRVIAWSVLEKPEDYSPQMGAIVADLRHDHGATWESFLAKAALSGIAVYHSKQVQENLSGAVSVEHLSENTFGSLMPNSVYFGIKSLLDWIAALVLLPFLLPVLIVIAGLVKSSSPGPVFFLQNRVGHRGHVFRLIKFRTMEQKSTKPREVTGGEDANVSLDDYMTKDDDMRVIRYGRMLRQFRLDELPQIFNILRGEMSWIGPRPEAVELSQYYESQIPFYSYRHIVRPGISGWAQVNQGHVTDKNEVAMKVRYDFFYIKYFSAWLDFLIIFKTVKTVLFRRGAK
ncbi:MAG: sugar transferase [Pseudomonadota bacterium]